MRYALCTNFPANHALVKQRNEVEIRQEEIGKRREQMFPISFDDFKEKAKYIQLRATRFLVADSVKQEKMISEFNWAWRQVQPLKDIFAKDKVFAGHLLVEEEEGGSMIRGHAEQWN
ncbi:hypothetical protein BYT27DRAFT_7219336 [Phlegmacium glaucopus]|nr:hypothetical protein BYT27DRAFT_7219336 [Phlegmacium glaucopus]